MANHVILAAHGSTAWEPLDIFRERVSQHPRCSIVTRNQGPLCSGCVRSSSPLRSTVAWDGSAIRITSVCSVPRLSVSSFSVSSCADTTSFPTFSTFGTHAERAHYDVTTAPIFPDCRTEQSHGVKQTCLLGPFVRSLGYLTTVRDEYVLSPMRVEQNLAKCSSNGHAAQCTVCGD
jgi:hypothetical protein